MKLAAWGSARERTLAGIGLVLLMGVGLSEIRQSVYLPKKQELFLEARRLERKLAELKYLQARSEEIRERFEAIDRRDYEAPVESANTAEDLLGRLEATARGNVHLVKVHPEVSDREGGSSKTKLFMEFIDERRRLDHFLYGLVQELGGDVQAFQASVGARGAIRCQATVLFTHEASTAAPDHSQAMEGEI
jgi:hypothetical protein